jgi:hypothetical protein
MDSRALLLLALLSAACSSDNLSDHDMDGGRAGDAGPAQADAGVSSSDAGLSQEAAVAEDAGLAEEAAVADAGLVMLPPLNAPFDYQIGGAYTPPPGVQIVSRDREAAPAAGLYNICYVNGFQAQPGEADFWLEQQPDLILRDNKGEPVVDPDWDEMLLDIASAAKRTRLAQIIGGFIAQCARDGFAAVEIDNLDSFSRSGGRLTKANAIAFVRLLADEAHAAGLAVAQKNGAELVSDKAAMGTDFVVAEECNQWDECDVYRQAYGDHVLVIEYQRAAFEAGCRAFPALSIVLRDLSVSPASKAGYVFDGC